MDTPEQMKAKAYAAEDMLERGEIDEEEYWQMWKAATGKRDLAAGLFFLVLVVLLVLCVAALVGALPPLT